MSSPKGTQVNSFTNGSSSEGTFTSMQQTIIDCLQQYNGIFLLNFESGNTGLPGIKAGSHITVNFVEYVFDTDAQFDVLQSDGTVVTADNASDGDYKIILKPSSDGTCTGYLMEVDDDSVVLNATYGGLYKTGTQLRVIGGTTRATSDSTTTYTTWVYATDRTKLIKIYPSGLYATIRELVACYDIGTTLGTLLSGSPALQCNGSTVSFGTFSLKFPCILTFKNSISTYNQWAGNVDVWIAPTCIFYLYVKIDDALKQILPGLTVNGENAMMAMPGIYALQAITTVGKTINDGPVYAVVNSYSLRVSNVFGSAIGSY